MASTTESSFLNSEIKDSVIEEKQSSSLQCPALPPFPLRPYSILSRSDSIRECPAAVENAPVKKSLHVRAYIPETPSIAPRFRKSGPADYFPWTGTHPEDVLSELTSRQGFYDKVQVSQNESSTARPCIWSSLKHKSGLQILSSLFVSAIDQRQAHRTVTASCTFKPPPRVTLTDTKREAWLRDLADPQIPLRRLSRTIPHGIRGKALLEHCLIKDIPITRAVWLAKCVGANEIRAFKRKGASGAFTVGGEEKWIKDWTTNVQHFVEAVMSECGALEWRSRIYYCLRLVAYLYSERLLNQDQYLEWITSSLRSCDLDSIPVWLLVAQINWKEILRYRQRGKHLTEAILIQLSKASESANGDTFSSLSENFIQLLISIMTISPTCFILPLCWNQYEEMIRSGFEKFGGEMVPEFERLCERNLQLQKSAISYVYSSQHVEQQQIIVLLDELPPHADISNIARECLAKFKNRSLFISTCLCWATSPSRSGSFRLYIAIRLFRLWARLHVEIEGPLLGFLAIHITMPPLQKANIYKVLAELVHSKTISVGKYLQRLMAKGSLAACKKTDGSFPTDVQWIFELPLDGLPDHVLNLRRILQASTGSSITKEKEDLAFAKAEISAKMQGFFAHTQVLQIPSAQKSGLAELSQTIKSALGRWVRQIVASQLLSRRPSTAQYDAFRVANMKGPFIIITPEQFGNIRSILETLDEYPILADIIKICCNSVDIMVLTVACETVNYHFEIFSAIGAANDLFQILYDRYEEFCSQAVKSKLLAESLSDLNLRLSDSRTERGDLQLLVPDYNPALSACSPISDYISEQLPPSESAFMESVEQSFTSGTMMEKQLLEKLFKKIMTELQRLWFESGEKHVSNLTDLLLRLRSYGVSTFETLFYQWFDGFFISTLRPKLQDVMPSLICAGIVTLSSVVEKIMLAYDAVGGKGHVAPPALEAFELLTISDQELRPMLAQKTYRFHAQKNYILRNMPSLIASVLRATISTCSNGNAMTLLNECRIIPLIQSLSQLRTGERDLISFALEDNVLLSPVQRAIDWVLYSSNEPERSDIDLRFRFSKLFLHVTIFNLPLCRLKLRAILMEQSQSQSHHDTAYTLISILREETILQSDEIINMWISLLSGVPNIDAIQIHEKAESELLSFFLETANESLAHHRRVMQSMIGVIDATANGITESRTSGTLLQVTEIINGILSTSMVVPGSPHQCEISHQDYKLSIDDSISNLDILLQLLSIHHSVGMLAKCSESVLVALLLALSNLLLIPSLSSHVELTDYILDVLTIITDSVAEEIRSQCIQILHDRNHSKDPRLQYVFGYSNRVESEWLQSVANPPNQSGFRIEDPQHATPARLPYSLRKWEMVQEATPLIAENDTSLSLTLFGTREVVF